MAKGMSKRAYARRRGVSESAVRKAAKTGRIPVRSDGTIDPKVADRAWAANTDPTKPLNSVTGSPKHRKEAPDAPSTPVEGPDRGAGAAALSTYSKARAMREGYAAKLTQLEFNERIGKLVRRDQVEASAAAAGQEIRDKLLALPASVHPDDRARREALAAEIRRVLEDLEKALRKLALPGPEEFNRAT